MFGSSILIVLAALSADEFISWESQALSAQHGPVAAAADLRTMQTRDLVLRSCAALDDAASSRAAAFSSGQWQAWRDGVRASVAGALGDMPFGEHGGPLNVRAVSRHERPGYVVENVLFESLPGFDVNASVYLPIAADLPPPWCAIVIPVGHSPKTQESYQIPAQAFARMGYVAVTFDPPGQGGEKTPGNDHFRDGVRCYLTGHSSNRYFIIDALRCIDYLATRSDVDMSNGVGMTGVSGGGMTTMFATLLDDRIRVAGPSCCAVPLALHPVLDGYAPCPETLAFGRLGLYDDIDLLAAAMPTPVLLMAGAADEVFTESMSRNIAEEVAHAFEESGQPDRFRFFLDGGGHDYSLAMAVEFAKEMDRWVQNIEPRTLPELKRDNFELAPDDILACHPRTDTTIFTINRDIAAALRAHRSGLPIPEAARRVACIAHTPAVPEAEVAAPELVWFHFLQEIVLRHENSIELPTTFFYPAKKDWKGSVLLYFDDRGRWTDLGTDGPLSRVSGALDKATDGPAILTVDVRGFGDSQPASTRYDIAGWGSRDRWTSYVSAGLGDPVMAGRIRDGLAALAYLRARPEIDPARIVVGGRGLGAIVAVHVAAIDGNVAGAVAIEGLAEFESLASTEDYAWPHETFLPNVLLHYDLPELIAALACPVFVAYPLDARKQPLTQDQSDTIFAMSNARVIPEIDWPAIRSFIQDATKD